jgi:thiosulfate/3-mercaptopyruvate sulfurtransferase
MNDWLIETGELARVMAEERGKDRVVVDCSWYLPEAGKHAIDDFRRGSGGCSASSATTTSGS